jgi:hypothetical protein
VDKYRRYLKAFNQWALHGFVYGIKSIKSAISMTAAVTRDSVKEAVQAGD